MSAKNKQRTARILGGALVLSSLTPSAVQAAGSPARSQVQTAVPYQDASRKGVPDWYLRTSATYHVDWPLLAALDVYGAAIKAPAGVTRPGKGPAPVVGFRFPGFEWSGLLNPQQADQNPLRISIFGGRGVDGDKDGKADQDNPYDRTAAIALWLKEGGPSVDEQGNVLFNQFANPVAAERIMAIRNVFQTFQTIQLGERAFPIYKRYHYSYNSTWGEGRSFGGRRMHEGTDIFADYGTPVLSTCFGYVELIGWNKLGGWRIGLRSADNTYFYYAHLSSYAKGIKQGEIVRPGQVIGYVGSSGYGKPGTAGKFPPHLHFGIYRDTGMNEWASDPYPLLKQWERKPQIVISPAKKS